MTNPSFDYMGLNRQQIYDQLDLYANEKGNKSLYVKGNQLCKLSWFGRLFRSSKEDTLVDNQIKKIAKYGIAYGYTTKGCAKFFTGITDEELTNPRASTDPILFRKANAKEHSEILALNQAIRSSNKSLALLEIIKKNESSQLAKDTATFEFLKVATKEDISTFVGEKYTFTKGLVNLFESNLADSFAVYAKIKDIKNFPKTLITVIDRKVNQKKHREASIESFLWIKRNYPTYLNECPLPILQKFLDTVFSKELTNAEIDDMSKILKNIIRNDGEISLEPSNESLIEFISNYDDSTYGWFEKIIEEMDLKKLSDETLESKVERENAERQKNYEKNIPILKNGTVDDILKLSANELDAAIEMANHKETDLNFKRFKFDDLIKLLNYADNWSMRNLDAFYKPAVDQLVLARLTATGNFEIQTLSSMKKLLNLSAKAIMNHGQFKSCTDLLKNDFARFKDVPLPGPIVIGDAILQLEKFKPKHQSDAKKLFEQHFGQPYIGLRGVHIGIGWEGVNHDWNNKWLSQLDQDSKERGKQFLERLAAPTPKPVEKVKKEAAPVNTSTVVTPDLAKPSKTPTIVIEETLSTNEDEEGSSSGTTNAGEVRAVFSDITAAPSVSVPTEVPKTVTKIVDASPTDFIIEGLSIQTFADLAQEAFKGKLSDAKATEGIIRYDGKSYKVEKQNLKQKEPAEAQKINFNKGSRMAKLSEDSKVLNVYLKSSSYRFIITGVA